MNRKISLLSLSLISVFFIAQFVAASTPFDKKADVFKNTEPQKKISELFLFDKNDAETISEEIKNDELPVGTSETFPVENPEGVVVFIPQTHMNPGTKVEDKANDSAEVAQKEIYEIVNHLNKETNIDFIMLEGEKFGVSNGEKSDKISEKLKIRNELVVKSEKLKEELKKENVSNEETNALLNDINKAIAYLDREISLQGAPYRIKAENESVVIYGSENPDTYEESSKIVKNYIYQKDQMKTIQGKSGGTQVASQSSSKNALATLKEKMSAQNKISGTSDAGEMSKLESIKKLLKEYNLDNTFSASTLSALMGKQNGDPIESASFQTSLNKIDTIGVESGNENICAIVKDIKNECSKLSDVRKPKNVVPNTTPVSERSNNPYSGIEDENELNKEIKATEEKIQEVVIDRRNRETAENFKKALAETGNEVGVLQFGAGHEEGMIAELNKQNLSVVVVKPNEVLRREVSGK